MKIEHLSPLHPTDQRVYPAYSEIINILLLSRHIVDMNRMLIQRNIGHGYGSLSGHSHWSFRNDCFTLWQRTGYNRLTCFPQRIIVAHFSSISARDKELDNMSLN